MDSQISTPQSKAALLTSAAILLRQAGYIQKAVEVLQAAVNEEEFVPAYTLLGAIQQELGNYEEAEKAYRQALKIEPDNDEALQGLGLFLHFQKRFSEALPYLEKHHQKSQTDLATIHGLLDCLEKLPDRESDFLNALKNFWEETKDPNLGIRYGTFLLDKGSKDEAQNVLKSVVAANKDPEICSKIAKIYYKREEFDNALQYYKLATEIDETVPSAWAGMAECYLALEQFDKAIEAIERAISINPNQYQYWRIKADVLYKSKQFEASLQSTQNALEIIRSLPNKKEINFVLLYFLRFLSLIELKKFDELLSEIQISIQEIPKAPIFYHFCTLGLLLRGHAKEALRVLNLVKDDELDDDLVLLRFETLMELGETQQAWEFIIPRLGKVITLEALGDIGIRLYLRGLPEPAIEIYRKLHEMDPHDIRNSNNLGFLLIERGEFDEAESLLVSVVTLAESESEYRAIAQCNLAYLYDLTSKYEKALEACDFVLSSNHKNEEAYLRVAFWLNGKIHPDPKAVPGRKIKLADAARACGAAAALASNQMEVAERYVEELIADTEDQDLAQLVKDCLLTAKGLIEAEEVWNRIRSEDKYSH